MKDHDELVWESKEFAERLKKITTENADDEQRRKVFDEYLAGVSESVRRDFKASLENIEEDSAMFTGLMLKVKQAFGKAKDEYLNASYELWEKFEAEIPSVSKKVDSLLSILKPLKDQLVEINGLVGKISTHDIDRLNESVSALANTYGKHKEMVEFLVKHFGRGEHANACRVSEVAGREAVNEDG